MINKIPNCLTFPSFFITILKSKITPFLHTPFLKETWWLPGVRFCEIWKVVDVYDDEKSTAFLNGVEAIWLRIASQNANASGALTNDAITEGIVHYSTDIRPAFVIDLSKVDYKTVRHVDYK